MLKIDVGINITEITPEKKNSYGDVVENEKRRKVVTFDLEFESIEDAQAKIQALLEIYK